MDQGKNLITVEDERSTKQNNPASGVTTYVSNFQPRFFGSGPAPHNAHHNQQKINKKIVKGIGHFC